MSSRLRVGILGATGMVGQRLVQLLKQHKLFELVAVYGRPENVGSKYVDTVNWVCGDTVPMEFSDLSVRSADDDSAFDDIEMIFSALPASLATKVEGRLRQRGLPIVSNAKSYRMENNVPLMVPEINAESIELIAIQKSKYDGGFIATNPNCCVIAVSLALGPIEKILGIDSTTIVTMQALSGAGLKGVYSYEAMGNVIPFIEDEEEKIKTEIPKIFSRIDISIRAKVNRVPVTDGHSFSIWFTTRKQTSKAELVKIWQNFEPACGRLPLLSSGNLFQIFDDKNGNRPQPRLDAWYLQGMGTAIGRIEQLSAKEFSISVVSNNIIRGASGGTLLIGEFLRNKGIV
jgi:aspartate-semialdehyde dehydrogenase